jgi:hypothetical protein
MVRYEGDRVAVVMAGWGTLTQAVSIRTRVPLEGRNLTRVVFRTGRAARLDDSGGPIAERVTAGGIRSAIATPIVVEGRVRAR